MDDQIYEALLFTIFALGYLGVKVAAALYYMRRRP